MIWTLKIECIWGAYLEEEFIRTIEIDSGSSLFDLHDFIQDMTDFDRDHLYDFFAGRHARNRNVIFADADEWEEREAIYSEITLEQIYPLPQAFKLYYFFDYGDSWYFEIKKSRKKPHEREKGVRYPRIVESIGPKPKQYGSWDDDCDDE